MYVVQSPCIITISAQGSQACSVSNEGPVQGSVDMLADGI